ncbi:MAG: methyltransferase domain-containing protein [Ruminococcus sp.]
MTSIGRTLRLCVQPSGGGTAGKGDGFFMSGWDAAQYLKFGAQRTQPSRDLAARIPLEQPRKIIDIGCGPGNSTEVLRQRFPQADILGVDSSPEMIRAAAQAHPEMRFSCAMPARNWGRWTGILMWCFPTPASSGFRTIRNCSGK